MNRVTMTDSSTPCWKKPPESAALAGAWRARWQLLLLACLLWFAACLPGTVRAQSGASITQMQVERTPEGMLLSAALAFDLPEHVEDALL